MLRTNGYISLSIFSSLILINPSFCRAESSLDASRDTIIQKQMDCVSHHSKSSGLDWQDLCEITDTSAQNQDDGKAQAVNEQLNTVEDSLPSGEVAKEFPNIQPDAQKEFSNSETDQPERPSAGSMLKDIVNPELSGVPRPKPPSNVQTRVHNFDVGAEVFYYRYQEPSYVTYYGNTEEDVKNRGPMYGYYANYAYRPAAPNFLNNFLANVYSLQARYATSRDLEYSGSGIAKSKHDDVDEFRGLIGKDYFIGSNMLVTPYFGFGYRYLFDHGNGEITSLNYYLYDRKSHYYYLPLGWDTAVALPRDWQMVVNAEYDIFLQGWQKSYLSDGNQYGYDNPDLNERQDHGFGLRASIRFIKKGRLVDFYVEPYIRYWNIEQSKGEYVSLDGTAPLVYVEPNNTTTEIGSKFGIQF